MENYAGFWLRVAAYLIDTIIMYVALLPIALIFGLGMAFESNDPAGGTDLLINLISFVGGWLYFALMESSAKQGTLGKMALGLVVTGLDGQRIGFGQATGRYFGKIVSALILLIGFIMAGLTARKQALHDIMANTLVLRGKPGEIWVDPDVFS